LQNAKKATLSQGLDHFNSCRVPLNGCKCATKNIKSKWEKECLKMNPRVAFKNSYAFKSL
jgi:hypothetical protein